MKTHLYAILAVLLATNLTWAQAPPSAKNDILQFAEQGGTLKLVSNQLTNDGKTSHQLVLIVKGCTTGKVVLISKKGDKEDEFSSVSRTANDTSANLTPIPADLLNDVDSLSVQFTDCFKNQMVTIYVKPKKGENEAGSPIKDNIEFRPPNSSADCQTTSTNCNARIIYDFSCQKFIFTKPNGQPYKSQKLHRIHPGVGSMVSIHAINYNPLTDNMDVSYKFEDRNREGQASFISLLSPSGKKEETSPASTTANGKSVSNQQDAYATLKNFASFLEEYVATSQTKLPCQIEQDIQDINRQAVEAGLGRSLAEWLDNGKKLLTNDELKKEYQPVLDRIAAAYRIITSYKVLQLPPIQIENRDLTLLDFTFSRKGREPDKRNYSFANSGGFKIDFSTGIGATGLIDEVFTTIREQRTTTMLSTSGVSTTITAGMPATITMGTSATAMSVTATTMEDIITRRNEGDFRLGLIVLSHAYFRTGWLINASFTGGFMVDNNVSTRYLLGGSLLMGRDQRLILTFGKAWGKVKRLDDGLHEGDIYTFGNGAKTIPTRDVTEKSWFVGVTYNFGSL